MSAAVSLPFRRPLPATLAVPSTLAEVRTLRLLLDDLERGLTSDALEAERAELAGWTWSDRIHGHEVVWTIFLDGEFAVHLQAAVDGLEPIAVGGGFIHNEATARSENHRRRPGPCEIRTQAGDLEPWTGVDLGEIEVFAQAVGCSVDEAEEIILASSRDAWREARSLCPLHLALAAGQD